MMRLGLLLGNQTLSLPVSHIEGTASGTFALCVSRVHSSFVLELFPFILQVFRFWLVVFLFFQIHETLSQVHGEMSQR